MFEFFTINSPIFTYCYFLHPISADFIAADAAFQANIAAMLVAKADNHWGIRVDQSIKNTSVFISTLSLFPLFQSHTLSSTHAPGSFAKYRSHTRPCG